MKRAVDLGLVLFERHLIWLLLVLIVLIGLNQPGFLSVRNLTNLLWAAAPLGCMVLGLFLVLLTRGLDLSLESIYAVAPVVAIVVVVQQLDGVVRRGLTIPSALLSGCPGRSSVTGFSVKLGVNAFLVSLRPSRLSRHLIFLIPEGVYYLPPAVTWLGAAVSSRRSVRDRPSGSGFVDLVGSGRASQARQGHLSLVPNPRPPISPASMWIGRASSSSCSRSPGGPGRHPGAGGCNRRPRTWGRCDILMVFAGAILGGSSHQAGSAASAHIWPPCSSFHDPRI
jgi:hypothetical protein